ncbi:MAG: hypothetical protein RL748_2217, partial [Pseudomonadota bacterium]
MELFLHEDKVAQLQASLAPLAGEARLNTMLALAWYQRQSQPVQALALVEQGRAELAAHDGTDDRHYW